MKRFVQKQRIKRQYAKEYRKAQKAGSKGSAAAKKAKDAVSSTEQAVIAAIKNHKGGLVVFGVLALLIIMLFSSLSSCSVMMEGAMGSILGTSYTSEDPDILQTETNYTALESQLSNIENTYSGYDEYRYDVDNIGHNPNELISYLTAKFDAFTPEQVQAELEAIFEKQYSLTTRAETEIRYRTETRTETITSVDPDTGEIITEEYTYEVEVPYEYHILYVTLRNKGFGTVAVEGLTEEQKERQ